jgi:1-acyl-sn-glycerol-3-phosphate acyltransferase
MITAKKSAWFERAFAMYNRNLLARRFEGLRVAGTDALLERPHSDAPLVLYANHSSWWDGLVAFQIGHACALAQFVLMEERQLRKHMLFRRLGAFSVVRERAREASRSIEYASALLRADAARALWIFPQGATAPNDARPLRFYSGIAHIIKRTQRAYVAPVALRYEFLEDFRPEAFARIGPLERIEAGADFDIKETTGRLAHNLTRTLDALRADVLQASLQAYVELVAPRRRSRAKQSGA